jgi:hypothetical protein
VFAVFFNQPGDLVQFCPAETTGSLESHRVEPEFGDHFLSLDMNVRWLRLVKRDEEKAVWANSQDRRHFGYYIFFWVGRDSQRGSWQCLAMAGVLARRALEGAGDGRQRIHNG